MAMARQVGFGQNGHNELNLTAKEHSAANPELKACRLRTANHAKYANKRWEIIPTAMVAPALPPAHFLCIGNAIGNEGHLEAKRRFYWGI